MIENKFHCYVNGFLKWNISKKTSDVKGNKKIFGKICILNLRNKRKSIFAGVINMNQRSEKIIKETDKIIIKSISRWNNRTKFRKSITRGEFVNCSSTIYTIRSKTRRIQLIIFNFIKKKFFVSTYVKHVSVELHVSRFGLHWAFRI